MFAVDASLPIVEKVDEIRWALQKHQVVIIAGETGSGKSTQIPKICLNLFQEDPRLIGHTQPRRLAAKMIAERVAEETKTAPGILVGYKIRFHDHMQKTTRLKLMTDGILLAETEKDRLLSAYKVIIIDEAHERSLNIDFLLGYLKKILPRRPDLKIIITSATLDHQRFSEHFEGAPLIEVSGRTYPVTLQYRPLYQATGGLPIELNEGIFRAIDALISENPLGGDFLVFLATEREIRDCQKFLERKSLKNIEILPLFSRLSLSDQQKIFSSRGKRKIVLSTNVAETSVTVPGVHYVVDSGLARLSRYSHRSKLQRLPIEPISQASANQRKGRCGRIAPGICIRLYSEEDFHTRKPFTEPEILRTNLAGVILKMAVMKLGPVEDFPFLTPPDSRFVKDGYRLLHELGAMNEEGTEILPLGKTLAKFSVDPRLAKMLTTAQQKKVLREMLVLTSFLSIPDIRERPMDHQAEADAAHKAFWVAGSDFLSILMLWVKAVLEPTSQGERRKLCQKSFLSFRRLREWLDLHQQLSEQVRALGWECEEISSEKWTENLNDFRFQQSIHQSLLSGLLSHVGRWEENKRYEGARQIKLEIFPGSVAFAHPPKWIMCYELVETHKAFARVVGKIDPLWLESLAAHLIKKSISDPFYEEESGRVCAWMKLSLYGLDVIPKRRVNYGEINPRESREIFIREALVAERFETNAPFILHNQKLEESLLPLENKARRLDVLVDEKAKFQFYDTRIPLEITDSIRFNAWWKSLQKQNPEYLKTFYMCEEDLISKIAHEATEFPDVWSCPPFKFPLRYHFDPMSVEDGVTVSIPSLLFREVPQNALEWGVSGLLLEKITALIRALPKATRRSFIPVPGVAKACLEALKGVDIRESLIENVALVLKRLSGLAIQREDFNLKELDPHLFMRVEILDAKGKVLKVFRESWEAWPAIEDYLSTSEMPAESKANLGWEKEKLLDWTFGDFPREIPTQFQGVSIVLYPAIEDRGDSVALVLESTREKAESLSTSGILRLLFLALQKEREEVRRRSNLPVQDKMLREDLEMASLLRVFGEFDSADTFPRNRSDFENLLKHRGEFFRAWEELSRQALFLLEEYARIQSKMKKLKGQLALIENLSDINIQLSELFYPGFIRKTPIKYFKRLNVYLKGVDVRLERLFHHPMKDREDLLVFRKNESRFVKWEKEEYRLEAFSSGFGRVDFV